MRNNVISYLDQNIRLMSHKLKNRQDKNEYRDILKRKINLIKSNDKEKLLQLLEQQIEVVKELEIEMSNIIKKHTQLLIHVKHPILRYELKNLFKKIHLAHFALFNKHINHKSRYLGILQQQYSDIKNGLKISLSCENSMFSDLDYALDKHTTFHDVSHLTLYALNLTLIGALSKNPYLLITAARCV